MRIHVKGFPRLNHNPGRSSPGYHTVAGATFGQKGLNQLWSIRRSWTRPALLRKTLALLVLKKTAMIDPNPPEPARGSEALLAWTVQRHAEGLFLLLLSQGRGAMHERQLLWLGGTRDEICTAHKCKSPGIPTLKTKCPEITLPVPAAKISEHFQAKKCEAQFRCELTF